MDTKEASLQQDMEQRIATGIRERREQLGLSVNELAARCGVSRAMIGKIENRQASPTAVLLGKVCNGLGLTLSSLIASAERPRDVLIARANGQPAWRDPDSGLLRTMVSPPAAGSRVEIVRIDLPPGKSVSYEAQRFTFYEQYVLVLEGRLTLTFAGETVVLASNDCAATKPVMAHAFANRERTKCSYLVIVYR